MIKTLFLLTILFSASSKAYASISEPISYWKKSEITVCWQDREELSHKLFTENQWSKLMAASKELKIMPLAQKQLIQKVIQAEYTKTRTGIHFVGWKSCKQEPKADTILITVISTSLPLGRSSVGRSETKDFEIHALPIDKKSFVLLNLSPAVGSVLSSESELTYTSIHEFGHLAGLRHENISPEAVADPNCTESEIGPEVSQESVHYLSDYDASSIMNYCLYNFIGNTGLSFKVDDFGNVLTSKNEILFPHKNLDVYLDELVIRRVEQSQYQARLTLSRKDLNGLRCIYLKKC